MSELQHRITAAERESFGLPDSLRQQVESLCDEARDRRNDGDPDMNDAWGSLFEAERIIRNAEKLARRASGIRNIVEKPVARIFSEADMDEKLGGHFVDEPISRDLGPSDGTWVTS